MDDLINIFSDISDIPSGYDRLFDPLYNDENRKIIKTSSSSNLNTQSTQTLFNDLQLLKRDRQTQNATSHDVLSVPSNKISMSNNSAAKKLKRTCGNFKQSHTASDHVTTTLSHSNSGLITDRPSSCELLHIETIVQGIAQYASQFANQTKCFYNPVYRQHQYQASSFSDDNVSPTRSGHHHEMAQRMLKAVNHFNASCSQQQIDSVSWHHRSSSSTGGDTCPALLHPILNLQSSVRATSPHLKTASQSTTHCWTMPKLTLNVQLGPRVGDPSLTSSIGQRCQLTACPNSTYVSELIIEVLAQASPNDVDAAEKYQLRIFGCAEYLEPSVLLSECLYIQLCHRLAQPIDLVIERKHPSSIGSSKFKFNSEKLRAKNLFSSLSPKSLDSHIIYTFNLLSTNLDRVRTIISSQADWTDDKEVKTSLLSLKIQLGQSMKAFGLVCEGLLFPEITTAWQLCQKELNVLLPSETVKKQVAGFLQKSQNKLRDPKLKSQLNSSLTSSIDSLKQSILDQLDAFASYRQLTISCAKTHQPTNEDDTKPLIDLDDIQGSLPSSVMDAIDRLGTRSSSVNRPGSVSSTESMRRPSRSSTTITNSFSINLIAVHRLHSPDPQQQQSEQSGKPSSSISSAGQTSFGGTPKMSSTSSAPDLAFISSQTYATNQPKPVNRLCNQQIYATLGLTYAGQPLHLVSPRDTGTAPRTCLAAGDLFLAEAGRLSSSQGDLILFDQLFRFIGFSISSLPKETMLAISVFSSKRLFASISDITPNNSTLIGWVNIPLFEVNSRLKQGFLLAGLWPPPQSPTEGLALVRPTLAQCNISSDCPIVQLYFPKFDYDIEYPVIGPCKVELNKRQPVSSKLLESVQLPLRYATNALLFRDLYSPEKVSDFTSKAFNAYTLVAMQLRKSSPSSTDLPQLDLTTVSSGLYSSSTQRLDSIGTGMSSNASPESTIVCYSPSVSLLAVEVLWNLKPFLTNFPSSSCTSYSLIGLLIGALSSPPQSIRRCTSSNTSDGGESWSWCTFLKQLYELLQTNNPFSPGLALRLLGPEVADQGVRHWAVRCLDLLSSDELAGYLVQLLEVLHYDLYLDYSGLITLFLTRSIASLRFANSLYWALNSSLAQLSASKAGLVDWRSRRLQTIKSVLLSLTPYHLKLIWSRQTAALSMLSKAAVVVKETRKVDSLHKHLDSLARWLLKDYARSVGSVSTDSSTGDQDDAAVHVTNDAALADPLYHVSGQGLRMPHQPGLLTHLPNIKDSSFFYSFTHPLRLVFPSLDGFKSPILLMYKNGDDLRLDHLILQLTFWMDRIWLNMGLDLRVITYTVFPTLFQQGIIEMIPDCTTLRHIQEQGGGLTGSFKDHVITSWLQSANPNPADYRQALENFIRSLAGWCVATYILGVGDRHNDNILIRRSGHIFHVDFAKVFGNVQTFAGIKRDRVPFVFTQSMIHVLRAHLSCAAPKSLASIDSSGRDSGLHVFTGLCCDAFNAIRRHAYDLIGLLEVAMRMDIPEINHDCIAFVVKALHLELSEYQACQLFTDLIRKSSTSKSTSLNFFIHSLAQTKHQSNSTSNSVAVGSSNFRPSSFVLSPTSNVVSVFDDLDLSPCSDEQTQSPDKSDGERLGDKSASVINYQTSEKATFKTFSPLPASFNGSNKIESVIVHQPVKKTNNGGNSDLFFPMDIWRMDSLPTRIYRRSCELDELCSLLVASINAGSLASDKIKRLTRDGLVESKAVANLAKFLIDQRQLEAKMMGSDKSSVDAMNDLIYTFFESNCLDAETAEDDPSSLSSIKREKSSNNMTSLESSNQNSPSSSSSTSLQAPIKPIPSPISLIAKSRPSTPTASDSSKPAICAKATLTGDRLELLLQGARGLYLPPPNKTPDTYVKIQLIGRSMTVGSGSTSSNRHKTTVIPNSSTPNYHTLIPYQVVPLLIQHYHIALSIWHAATKGGHICLGYRQLSVNELIGGQLKWFTLSQLHPGDGSPLSDRRQQRGQGRINYAEPV